MKIVWDILILIAFVFLAMVAIMAVPFLRKGAGYGKVEPTGIPAAIAGATTKAAA